MAETINMTYYTQVGIVLLVPLFFLFLMYVVNAKRTQLLFKSLLSNQYFYSYPLDTAPAASGYYFLCRSFIYIVLSLFFMLFLYDTVTIYDNFLFLYFELLGYVIAYSLLKYVVLELVCVLLNKKKRLKRLLVLETTYLTSILLVLYVLVFYAYLHLNQQVVWCIVLLISALLLYVVRGLGIFANNKNIVSSNLFYIILYLCILEIFPIIYLFKGYTE